MVAADNIVLTAISPPLALVDAVVRRECLIETGYHFEGSDWRLQVSSHTLGLMV